MCTAADRVAGSSHGNSAGAAAKRKAPSTGGVVKKGPASVLARISNLNSENQVVMPVMNAENTDKSLEVVKLEEAKYASICVSVYANTEQFMDAGIFDLGLFWSCGSEETNTHHTHAHPSHTLTPHTHMHAHITHKYTHHTHAHTHTHSHTLRTSYTHSTPIYT